MKKLRKLFVALLFIALIIISIILAMQEKANDEIIIKNVELHIEKETQTDDNNQVDKLVHIVHTITLEPYDISRIATDDWYLVVWHDRSLENYMKSKGEYLYREYPGSRCLLPVKADENYVCEIYESFLEEETEKYDIRGYVESLEELEITISSRSNTISHQYVTIDHKILE